MDIKNTINVLKNLKIAYLCDGTACKNCSGDCTHTADIRHAKNFKEVAPGKFMEKEAPNNADL